MAPKLRLALLIVAVIVVATIPSSHSGDSRWLLPMHPSRCDGRVGDCIDAVEETQMNSEGAHRQLYWDQDRYISYEAMRRNNIPCLQPGQSYYNCRRNAQVNPYRRGCTAITMCARVW